MAYERWQPKLPRWCRWDILMSTLTKSFKPSLRHSSWAPLAGRSCTAAGATNPDTSAGSERTALNTPSPFVCAAIPRTASLHPATVTHSIHKLQGNPCCWGRNWAKPTARTARGSFPPDPTTLLPPVHAAPVTLTVVVHNNLTPKHNSAEGEPPSHRQQMYPVTLLPAHLTPWVTGAEGMCSAYTQNFSTFFFPGAYHSPCLIAC